MIKTRLDELEGFRRAVYKLEGNDGQTFGNLVFAPEELLAISSDGDDPRIFFGFEIFDSGGMPENLASIFLGSLILVRIFWGY